MESPIALGDTTTNSINQKLSSTHLGTKFTLLVHAVEYGGEKCIQLVLDLGPSLTNSSNHKLEVLRRVQDSYVNITQLLQVLVNLNHMDLSQIQKYIHKNIRENPQYFAPNGYIPEFNDLSSDKNSHLAGIWVSFDKAVSIALEFDLYDMTKKLFLVDVHDFDELPKLAEVELASRKRRLSQVLDTPDTPVGELVDSGASGDQKGADFAKKIKSSGLSNLNYPYPLPALSLKDKESEVVNEAKLKFSDIFKKNESVNVTKSDVEKQFSALIKKTGVDAIADLPLDNDGKTALHFAATLAAPNLVEAFVSLGLTSASRGSKSGETPLVSAILVTNSMAKDNFDELLEKWLYPGIFLINSRNYSVFHHLASQSVKKSDSTKYYTTLLVKYLLNGLNTLLKKLVDELINLQDTTDGNTAIHLAAEQENAWMVELLYELRADLNTPNKAGVKPIEYDLVKEVVNYSKLGIKTALSESDSFLVELIRTSFEFLESRQQITSESLDDETIVKLEDKTDVSTKDPNELTATNRLFNSINELLKNTNNEYETIMNKKKQQINELNKQLHDTTVLTANNRHLNRKISEKLMYLDNLKLQMSNITEKLDVLRKELPEDQDEDEEAFDADHPFRIEKIHLKLVSKESLDDLANDSLFIDSLPESLILQARISAYKELNQSLESEVASLQNYDELTSKFKKVVSFCTGVDINEVDELLDGLLEAVESQN